MSLPRLAKHALAAELAAVQQRYRTLFETLPLGVIYYAADGLITAANPAASEMIGVDSSDMLTWPTAPGSHAVREDGTPFPAEEVPVAVALRTGEVVADVLMGLPHGQTGELRWLLVTAVPEAPDQDGRPQRAYAIFKDLTEQRRTEVTLRGGIELMARLSAANVLGMVVADEERVYDANDAYLEIIGYGRDDLKAGGIAWRAITPPEWAEREDDAIAQLRQFGACRPFEKEYVHRDGHRVPVLVGAAVTRRHPLRWASYVVDLTASQRAKQERAELLAREQAARNEVQRARERVSFLLGAGNLAAAGDRYELLQRAAELVVRSIADLCVVFLPDGDGELCATSIAHRDPLRGVTVADLRDYRVAVDGHLTIQAAWATGASQLSRGVADRIARQTSLSPVLRELLDRLNPEHLLATPIQAGGRPLGVLALCRSADRPGYGEADIAVVETLARRIAAGLANAEASARDHTVAETLQRAVLPATLPEIAGLQLAVRYLPATDGINVGGDWYDAFPLSGNRMGLAVGDVVGHNITSASIMGQVRNMLRAYAVDAADPSDVLHRANVALSQLLPDAMATAIYAVLDPATGDLSYANAGHPPPVCVSVTGSVDYLDAATGTMLGALGDGVFTTGHRRLPPGTVLLLYTDGLIESHDRDISDGFTALAGAMHQARGLTADQTCTAVQTVLLAGAPRADDVCLLAGRLTS
ncbi:MAG: SpoIIE family protein phosphatase [Streptosporangiaceae bacterium]